MVVSGKKSNLELKGLRRASTLREKQRPPPSSQLQDVILWFPDPRVPHCLSTGSTCLPAVSQFNSYAEIEHRLVLAEVAKALSPKDCLPRLSEAEMVWGDGYVRRISEERLLKTCNIW